MELHKICDSILKNIYYKFIFFFSPVLCDGFNILISKPHLSNYYSRMYNSGSSEFVSHYDNVVSLKTKF